MRYKLVGFKVIVNTNFHGEKKPLNKEAMKTNQLQVILTPDLENLTKKLFQSTLSIVV